MSDPFSSLSLSFSFFDCRWFLTREGGQTGYPNVLDGLELPFDRLERIALDVFIGTHANELVGIYANESVDSPL